MPSISRLRELEKRLKMQQSEKQDAFQRRIDALIGLFPLIYGREASDEEIAAQRERLSKEKPASVKGIAEEIEILIERGEI